SLRLRARNTLLSRGGVAARQRKSCEATLARADGLVLVTRTIFWTSTTPAAATASAFPSSALEELEIGLNVFNELDDADFSRYSSPTGEKYRSSSSETGRPAATPLRRGVSLSRFQSDPPWLLRIGISRQTASPSAELPVCIPQRSRGSMHPGSDCRN